MKPTTITTVLQEKLKEMKKYLARFEKDLKAMRQEKHLAHAPDMLEGLSHQIGYMNGAIEQTEQFLRMIEITDKAFWDQRKASEESLKRVREQMDEMIREHKAEHKTPKQSK